MAIYRAQVTLPYFTGIPSDVATNTYHFSNQTNPDLEADCADIEARVEELYQLYIGSYIGGVVSRVLPTRLRIYRLEDATPRAPVRDVAISLGNPSAPATLPLEVAACVSFQGPPVSGVPQGRRRGRVYIGPLQANAVVDGTASVMPSILPAFATAAGAGFEKLADTVARPNLYWVVYSQAGPTNAVTNVTQLWVNNEPDTQRRRGAAPTSRTNFVISQPTGP